MSLNRFYYLLIFLSATIALSSLASAQVAPKDTTLTMVLPDSLYDRSVFVPKQPGLVSRPFRAQRGGLVQLRNMGVKTKIELDSTGMYRLTQTIDGIPFGEPISMSLEEYSAAFQQNYKTENLRKIAQVANNRLTAKDGLIDFKFSIPGGKQSVFSTIFGKPEVNLRVTGTANMNIGASIQRDENPSIPEDQRQRIDPTFQQNLKLNIQGGIGDKLTINTDWDTERPFDYQNRLKIAYTGYDDEIIKSVELGNVGMETGNSLITGGQALFGIKTVAQMGAFKLTSVISQKEGQGNSKSIDGGSTEETFNLNPTDYENDRHFYIDFYSYERYDEALKDPIFPVQLFNISQMVVYKLNLGTQRNENIVQGIALVDLGVTKDSGSQKYLSPNVATDGLDDSYLEQLKTASLDTVDVISLANRLGVKPANVLKGYWTRLENGVDYKYDKVMGTISLLNAPLQSNEALAIAFQNQTPTGVHEIGDVLTLGEEVQILKLLRQQNVNSEMDTWKLTMRNVYSLGLSNISSSGLDFGLFYTKGNTPVENLPGISASLLNLLGLDRLNANQEKSPDNLVDFSTGVIDGVNGKIYFPYREPFGERIAKVIQESSIPDKETALDEWVFSDLYNKIQGVVRQDPKRNLFAMSGKVKGGSSGSFYLGYSVVEGSVKVFANGAELQEGLDYEVDYSIGNVFITNSRYLAPGQQIKIDFESNNILQIQQTIFTGVRGEYEFNENIKLGATYFNLKDRPLTDKIRIGDEPINNSIYGFDAKASFDAPWLTKAVDWLPLLETKAPSKISFTGEFAQLKPGVAQTNAVQDAINKGRLYPDEEQGVSFIDEFEGAKTSFSFLSPARWYLAAAPASIHGYDNDLGNPVTNLISKIERSDLRSQFSWYTLPLNVSSILNAPRNRETRLVQVNDIFDRQTLQQDNYLNTLDIFYNPRVRGVYNYNMNLKDLLENRPEETWGGMTTVLPQGLENLTLNNIEFVEFWVQPIIPDSIVRTGSTATQAIMNDYNGKIYLDLGIISEDVIPNNSSNNEDGLAQAGKQNIKEDFENMGVPSRSLILNKPVDFDGQFSVSSLEDEDVGLDGVPNEPNFSGRSEREFFHDFVENVRLQYGENSQMYKEVLADPSNDDYFYWAESALNNKTLQERFLRMFGYTEQNSRTTGEKRAITNRPDAEGLLIPTFPQMQNAYFQYELDLNPADPTTLTKNNPFIVDIADDKNDVGQWYQVRIPLQDYKRMVGGAADFQAITHMRLWMSGYKRPFTLRFATFELVGSQWRKAETVGNVENSATQFLVSTINVEENRNRRPVPYLSPRGAIRAINRTQQGNILANEQALSLEVKNLQSGDIRMIRRNFTGGMNLMNYSNLRMFAHAEGFNKRGETELVVRLGRDLNKEYYEYRQPLTPTDTLFFNSLARDFDSSLTSEVEERVWLPDENSMNVVLSRFNSLKQLRNLRGVDPSITFYDSTLVVGESPQGTMIGIRGNPSLQNITEIGIGVMSPSRLEIGSNIVGRSTASAGNLDATVWVNELRVSGFDNEEGWQANTSMQIQFADVASVSGKVATSTSGFGSLTSRLGSRQREDRFQYDISTTFNAHKLFPERYGWNLPIGFSYSQSIATPQYLPREGDIRLSDFKNAVLSQEIPNAQKDSIIHAKVNEIQTYSDRMSLTLSNVSKKNSSSNWLKYTVDNLSYNYSYSQDFKRDITYNYERSWNINTGLGYSYTWRKIDMLRPFWFTEKVPYLGFLYDLQLGYVPSSIKLSGTLARTYSERSRREFGEENLPLIQSHQFDFNQNFNLSYNLTPTILLSFNSTAKYLLNDAGEKKILETETEEYQIIPTWTALGKIVSVDSIHTRQDNYNETYSASWQPATSKISWLSWFTYKNSYQGGFKWQNSALGSNLGASLTNTYTMDQSSGIKFQDLFKKIPLYNDWVKNVEQNERDRAKKEADKKRQQAQLERQRELAKKNPQNAETPKAPAQTAPKKEESEDPLIDWGYYGRKTALALLSIQNFDVTYKHSENSAQNGYSGGSSLFDSFNNPETDATFSPPFSYRIGLKRLLDQVVPNPSDANISINQNEGFINALNITAKLQPFKNITVDLSWNVGWSNSRSNLFMMEPGASDFSSNTFNENGDLSTSAWVFGGNFEQFYRMQLQRGLDDYNATTNKIDDSQGNKDGLTILDRDAIQRDYLKTYLGYSGNGYGKKGYLPFPMPNWSLNWSGLESYIPFLQDYISRVSINHVYSGSYRLGWKFNNISSISSKDFTLSGTSVRVTSQIQSYEPASITTEKKFMPLIGLNITWKNNVSTRLQYDYTLMQTLTAENPLLTEKTSQGFKFTGSWSKRGFVLPFFRKLRNTLDLSVSASYYNEANIRRQLTSILSDGLSQGLFSMDANDYDFVDNSKASLTGDMRLKLSALVGYQFSSMIKANLEYTYDHVIPKSTGTYERIAQDIRFNVIVTIRSR